MKIRTGFVSNSSSASFVLELDMSWDDVKSILREIYLDFGFPKPIKEKWENYLTEQIEYYKDKKEDTGYIDECEETLKELQEIDWGEVDDTDKFIDIWFREKLRVDVEEKDNVTTFEWGTHMHNDFNESIPDPLKELILYLVMEGKSRKIIRAQVKDD